jgi:hypothetical protein
LVGALPIGTASVLSAPGRCLSPVAGIESASNGSALFEFGVELEPIGELGAIARLSFRVALFHIGGTSTLQPAAAAE